MPVKVLRFIATSVLGKVVPGVGEIAGLADSFFLERWLRGHSPKFFIDDLAQLAKRKR